MHLKQCGLGREAHRLGLKGTETENNKMKWRYRGSFSLSKGASWKEDAQISWERGQVLQAPSKSNRGMVPSELGSLPLEPCTSLRGY